MCARSLRPLLQPCTEHAYIGHSPGLRKRVFRKRRLQKSSEQYQPDELCYRKSDCPLSNGEDGECWCGFNTEGMAFCTSQPGDSEFLVLKSALLATVDASTACHFNTSLTPRAVHSKRRTLTSLPIKRPFMSTTTVSAFPSVYWKQSPSQ